jgi:hypothetical protein
MIHKHAFPSLRSTGRVAYIAISVEPQMKKGTNTDHVPPKSGEITVWVNCSQFFENRPRLLHRRHFRWVNGTAKEQLVIKTYQLGLLY